MSFTKGGVSYSVYELGAASQVPTEEDLRFMAFVPIDDTTEELSGGLVDFMDMTRFDFSTITPEYGEYICLGYRVDRRSVSGATRNRLVWEKIFEEQEAAAAAGQPATVSTTRKREIKAEVQQYLMSRAVPIPKKYEIVVNREEKRVYLEHAPAAVTERMVSAVEYVLGSEITRIDSTYLAYSAVQNHDAIPGDEDLDTEFLEHVFFSEMHSYGPPFEVVGTLELSVPSNGEEKPMRMRCSDPSLRNQIADLLQQDGILHTAQLGINPWSQPDTIPEGVNITLFEDVKFTVAPGLTVKSVKLPRVELFMEAEGSEVTMEGTFLLRMEMLEQLTRLLHHRFNVWAAATYA